MEYIAQVTFILVIVLVTYFIIYKICAASIFAMEEISMQDYEHLADLANKNKDFAYLLKSELEICGVITHRQYRDLVETYHFMCSGEKWE